MVSGIRFLLLFRLLSTPVFAALDLTPIPSIRDGEGTPFHEILFHDGTKTVHYDPPPGWTFSGGGSQVKLIPPGLSQAEGTIEAAPASDEKTSREARLPQLRDAVLRLAPAGAEHAELAPDDGEGGIQVDGKSTIEIGMTYLFAGVRFQTAVFYLDLPNNQVKFRLVSKAEDFAKLRAVFRKSLCSLNWADR
jgi:hypothetical protein